MFKRIEVSNFQAHDYSVFNFCKGVNIITGQSDVGKSSFFRSFVCVKDNRPTGFAFRSDFAPKDEATVVSIDFMDAEQGSCDARKLLDNSG